MRTIVTISSCLYHMLLPEIMRTPAKPHTLRKVIINSCAIVWLQHAMLREVGWSSWQVLCPFRKRLLPCVSDWTHGWEGKEESAGLILTWKRAAQLKITAGMWQLGRWCCQHYGLKSPASQDAPPLCLTPASCILAFSRDVSQHS